MHSKLAKKLKDGARRIGLSRDSEERKRLASALLDSIQEKEDLRGDELKGCYRDRVGDGDDAGVVGEERETRLPPMKHRLTVVPAKDGQQTEKVLKLEGLPSSRRIDKSYEHDVVCAGADIEDLNDSRMVGDPFDYDAKGLRYDAVDLHDIADEGYTERGVDCLPRLKRSMSGPLGWGNGVVFTRPDPEAIHPKVCIDCGVEFPGTEGANYCRRCKAPDRCAQRRDAEGKVILKPAPRPRYRRCARAGCNDLFEPRSKNHVHCTPDCRKRASEENMIVKG
ncbi:MAG TPA: hypothetical protein VJP02_16630 [Candidatus Sulfotelmatobacter sp.]|nr:hypothetical protein [Candidatus Sulfotelmatobacter sp.]